MCVWNETIIMLTFELPLSEFIHSLLTLKKKTLLMSLSYLLQKSGTACQAENTPPPALMVTVLTWHLEKVSLFTNLKKVPLLWFLLPLWHFPFFFLICMLIKGCSAVTSVMIWVWYLITKGTTHRVCYNGRKIHYSFIYQSTHSCLAPELFCSWYNISF